MDMRTAAVGMHEAFRSFVEAGFTEAQAMQLVVALLTVTTGEE